MWFSLPAQARGKIDDLRLIRLHPLDERGQMRLDLMDVDHRQVIIIINMTKSFALWVM